MKKECRCDSKRSFNLIPNVFRLVSSVIVPVVLLVVVLNECLKIVISYDADVFDLDIPLDGVDLSEANSRLRCQPSATVSSVHPDGCFVQAAIVPFAREVARLWINAIVVDESVFTRITTMFEGTLVLVR